MCFFSLLWSRRSGTSSSAVPGPRKQRLAVQEERTVKTGHVRLTPVWETAAAPRFEGGVARTGRALKLATAQLGHSGPRTPTVDEHGAASAPGLARAPRVAQSEAASVAEGGEKARRAAWASQCARIVQVAHAETELRELVRDVTVSELHVARDVMQREFEPGDQLKVIVRLSCELNIRYSVMPDAALEDLLHGVVADLNRAADWNPPLLRSTSTAPLNSRLTSSG